jgi:hypothetical protein
MNDRTCTCRHCGTACPRCSTRSAAAAESPIHWPEVERRIDALLQRLRAVS